MEDFKRTGRYDMMYKETKAMNCEERETNLSDISDWKGICRKPVRDISMPTYITYRGSDDDKLFRKLREKYLRKFSVS